MMNAALILLASFTLVAPDRTATVVLPEKPELSSELAATELTNYVARATGVALTVGSRVPRDRSTVSGRAGRAPLPAGSVVVGTLDTLGEDVPEVIRKALEGRSEDEAYWVGTEGGNLWFIGKNETGELRGMYRFLEDKLGVRWFKAATKEDPGDFVPRIEVEKVGGGGEGCLGLVIQDFVECGAPHFMLRRLDQSGAWGNRIPVNAMTFANRIGFQTYPAYGARVPFDKPESEFGKFFGARIMRKWQPLGGGHHSIVDAIPADTYFKDHPEYFTQVNGKRVKGQIYCLSNPDVIRLTADYYINLLKREGGHGHKFFGQVDLTHGWCECERCVAANGGAGSKDISVVYASFVQQVCARIWAACPEANLSTWAYNTYRKYPGFEHDPRLRIWYCTHGRCHGHALDDPSCYRNVEIRNEIERWHAPGRDIFFYDYLTCAPIHYGCAEAVEAHDIKYYAKMGYRGWKNEAQFSDGRYNKANTTHPDDFPSNWQWLYTVGHLLQNPSLDAEALVNEAEEKYYGAAYPAMKKYHAERRRLWAKAKACVGYPFGDTRTAVLLEEPGAEAKLFALLDQADQLAESGGEGARRPTGVASSEMGGARRPTGDVSSGVVGRSPRDRRVLKSRLALDRGWLQKYWVEPNRKYKKVEASVLKVPCAEAVPAIDGSGDDAAWQTAATTDDFRGTPNGYGLKCPKIDERLRTEVKVLRDKENFYLLLTVKEPKLAELKFAPAGDPKIWGEEHIEVIFFPPVIDCRTYQLAFNAEGSVQGLSNPGGTETDYGVEAAAKKGEGVYVIEAKVPNRLMHEFIPGERWKVLFGRYRVKNDEIVPNHWQRAFSVGGCNFQDTTSYTPVDIVD